MSYASIRKFSHSASSDRRTATPSACHRHLPAVSGPLRKSARQQGRAYLSVRASRDKPDGDKSWGEIAADAADVAKSVFSKIKDTASSILTPAPTTKPTEEASSSSASRKPAPRQTPDDLGLSTGGGGLLPNLVGRAMGGLISGALSSLTKQLQEAAKEQQGVYEEAAERIRTSAKLRTRLGNVTVGPLMSQSSSSSSINGRVTKQIVLLMPVYGAGGDGGTAQVAVTEGPQGRSMQISVRTSDGAVVVVDDGGSGGGGPGGRGSVIDVEYREVKKG